MVRFGCQLILFLHRLEIHRLLILRGDRWQVKLNCWNWLIVRKARLFLRAWTHCLTTLVLTLGPFRHPILCKGRQYHLVYILANVLELLSICWSSHKLRGCQLSLLLCSSDKSVDSPFNVLQKLLKLPLVTAAICWQLQWSSTHNGVDNKTVLILIFLSYEAICWWFHRGCSWWFRFVVHQI